MKKISKYLTDKIQEMYKKYCYIPSSSSLLSIILLQVEAVAKAATATITALNMYKFCFFCKAMFKYKQALQIQIQNIVSFSVKLLGTIVDVVILYSYEYQ